MCVFLRLAAQTEDPTVLLELLRALKGVGGGGGRGETGSGGVFWVGKLWASELKGNQEESAGLSTGSLFSSDPVLHPAASHPRLSLCEDPDLPCLPPPSPPPVTLAVNNRTSYSLNQGHYLSATRLMSRGPRPSDPLIWFRGRRKV